MYRAPARKATLGEPFLLRHAWLAALLLGTAATPSAVILAVLAPRHLGAVLIWPLGLLTQWAGPSLNIGTPERPFYEGTFMHLAAMALGGVLTWLFYVLLARVVLWRVAARRAEGVLIG
jgi:hypothetical protein